MKNVKKATEWNILDHLKTEEDIANYLEAALEENDIEFFLIALGDVAKARSINKIAKEIGVGRESLYKSFSGARRPNVETVFKAIDALGLKVNFT
ncbi:MAG: putative addiction module antidote protein, partial [Alphaproteobacteria bacterium]|nr:putative addiction module antidote protein [Alphaproteobacteria bacterium]